MLEGFSVWHPTLNSPIHTAVAGAVFYFHGAMFQATYSINREGLLTARGGYFQRVTVWLARRSIFGAHRIESNRHLPALHLLACTQENI